MSTALWLERTPKEIAEGRLHRPVGRSNRMPADPQSKTSQKKRALTTAQRVATPASWDLSFRHRRPPGLDLWVGPTRGLITNSRSPILVPPPPAGGGGGGGGGGGPIPDDFADWTHGGTGTTDTALRDSGRFQNYFTVSGPNVLTVIQTSTVIGGSITDLPQNLLQIHWVLNDNSVSKMVNQPRNMRNPSVGEYLYIRHLMYDPSADGTNHGALHSFQHTANNWFLKYHTSGDMVEDFSSGRAGPGMQAITWQNTALTDPDLHMNCYVPARTPWWIVHRFFCHATGLWTPDIRIYSRAQAALGLAGVPSYTAADFYNQNGVGGSSSMAGRGTAIDVQVSVAPDLEIGNNSTITAAFDLHEGAIAWKTTSDSNAWLVPYDSING